ncbi:MAG: hypothetical protein HRT99_04335 [Mycoplasmatales bacterium]|nr:hypothetical protein [Mycoplasmatales bacterium]
MNEKNTYKTTKKYIDIYVIFILTLISLAIGIFAGMHIVYKSDYMHYRIINVNILSYALLSISILTSFLFLYLLIMVSINKTKRKKIVNFIFKYLISGFYLVIIIILSIDIFYDNSYLDYRLNPNITIVIIASIFAYLIFSIFSLNVKNPLWREKNKILLRQSSEEIKKVSIFTIVTKITGLFSSMSNKEMKRYYYKKNFGIKNIRIAPTIFILMIASYASSLVLFLLFCDQPHSNNDLQNKSIWVILIISFLYLFLLISIFGAYYIPFYILSKFNYEYTFEFLESYFFNENIPIFKLSNNILNILL